MRAEWEVPSPNAYDYYAEAGRKLRESLRRDDRYIKVCDPILPEDLPKGVDPSLIPTEPLEYLDLDNHAPEDQRDILDRSSEALRILRQGFEYPYLTPWEMNFASVEGYAEYPMMLRDVTKVLSIESEAFVSEGAYDRASSSLIDIIRIGSDIPRGGLLMGALLGRALESLGSTRIWELVDRLSPRSALSLAKRLEEIVENEWPLSQTMEAEMRWYEAQYARTMAGPFWRFAFVSLHMDIEGSSDGWPSSEYVRRFLRLVPLSRKRAMLMLEDKYDDLVRRAELPYPLAENLPTLPADALPWYAIGLPRVQLENGRTQKRLLMTSLALHAFRGEHGRYPDALDNLVPDYLSAVPDDPYSNGELLRYRIDGEKYILYSIGPDGVDDGGRPIENPPSECGFPRPHQVMNNSMGDIVAGVNR